MYLLYLDRYHLGDFLFVQSLARFLGRMRRERPPCVVVHGSGEAVERLLEGEGIDVVRAGDVLQVATQGERALVEQGMRHTNRKLVQLFTDELVSAVGLHGLDRGLLRQNAGGVEAGRLDWLAELAAQGAVPVVSSLVRGAEGAAVEASAPAALVALGAALGGPTAVFFTSTNEAGLPGQDAVPVGTLAGAGVLPEPVAAARAAEAGLPVLLTSIQGLLGAEGVRGTWVERIKT